MVFLTSDHSRCKFWLPIATLVAALLLVLVAAGATAAGTTTPKRTLGHGDFDAWRTIATPVLSHDGKWLAYSVQPQDGDGELVIRDLSSGHEKRHVVGKLPPPMVTPNEENPNAPPAPRAIQVVFTSDNRFLLATTHPSKAETIAAQKARKRPDDMPKGGLLMINLASGDATRVANVKTMQVPAKGGAWVAYLKEETKPEHMKAAEPANAAVGKTTAKEAAKSESPTAAKPDENDDQAAARRAAASSSTGTGATTSANTTGSPPAAKFGTDLVLHELATGTERTFTNVMELSFARDGKTLLYTVVAKAEADNGIYAMTPQTNAAPVALLTGKGKFLKPIWDREQTQAAFVSDRDDAAAKTPQFKLYHWLRGTPVAVERASTTTPGFPAGMVVSDNGSIAFSRDGKKLYVPVAPPAKPLRQADAGPPGEQKIVADLWRWNDDVVQSIQKVRATQERNRSFRGVIDLTSGRYQQLADETMRTVSMSDDGLRAVGSDDRAYRRLVDYSGTFSDIYVVDPANGTRKLALKKLRDSGNFAQSQWAPDGKWLIYFQNKHWHALNSVDGSSKNLTAALKFAVFNEEHDTPAPANSYGTAGWTSDSASVLINDRYDVWQIFMDGRPAHNLSRGEGRKSKVRLRVQPIDPLDEDDDERGIDPTKPLVLRGESDVTRASGFFRTTFVAESSPRRLVWGDKNYRYVGRAQDANVFLTTASRFDRFPDLQSSDANFANMQKITDVGAQMTAFDWGSSELMSFKNAKGVPLSAAVYKPANFDPKKKYPLMVYIYERLSQDVNSFVNPAPSQNINRALYTSNGYVILTPDIAYTTGQPGKSALDAVLPAIDKLVKQGFIDEKAIGIQGHSWGGYQIAWMITQTNRFAAAEAGAPVANMTSAYSGIRWGSGLPRQFQYEQQQSRIGKSLQDDPMLFLANSPVFHITKVKTPLLILHNDNDDAVPWYQGIELFLAMRRHNKEAYYFNYNGQLHGLRRRADQKDFGFRMHQFFDHFLKGAPKPEWMEKGISFLDREDEKERFNQSATTSATATATTN